MSSLWHAQKFSMEGSEQCSTQMLCSTIEDFTESHELLNPSNAVGASIHALGPLSHAARSQTKGHYFDICSLCLLKRSIAHNHHQNQNANWRIISWYDLQYSMEWRPVWPNSAKEMWNWRWRGDWHNPDHDSTWWKRNPRGQRWRSVVGMHKVYLRIQICTYQGNKSKVEVRIQGTMKTQKAFSCLCLGAGGHQVRFGQGLPR